MAERRQLCIFMTATPTTIGDKLYYYSEDSILVDKDKNESIVIYQCQKSMKRHDDALKNENVDIKVFYREKNSQPFTYIGHVKSRQILKQRSEGADRLTMQFNVSKTESLCIQAPATRGQGKFKIPVFNALNVDVKSKCYMHGIMEVFPRTH